MSKKKTPPPTAPEPPFHNPFAALAQGRDQLPPPKPTTTPPPAPRPAPQATPQRAVHRRERKGRGGKTATVVTHLNLAPDDLERWSKELRRTLGCGGAVEDDTLVFQGDHRERLAALLQERGVGRITQG